MTPDGWAALLNAGLLIAAAGAALLALWDLRQTGRHHQQQIQKLEEGRRDSFRPLLQVRQAARHLNGMTVDVMNIGTGPALDVHLELHAVLTELEPHTDEYGHTIDTLKERIRGEQIRYSTGTLEGDESVKRWPTRFWDRVAPIGAGERLRVHIDPSNFDMAAWPGAGDHGVFVWKATYEDIFGASHWSQGEGRMTPPGGLS